jgi:hypothetical protein
MFARVDSQESSTCWDLESAAYNTGLMILDVAAYKRLLVVFFNFSGGSLPFVVALMSCFFGCFCWLLLIGWGWSCLLLYYFSSLLPVLWSVCRLEFGLYKAFIHKKKKKKMGSRDKKRKRKKLFTQPLLLEIGGSFVV